MIQALHEMVINNGKGLSPVHRSTRPVEMLIRIQKLYKIEHVITSQRSSAPVHWTQASPIYNNKVNCFLSLHQTVKKNINKNWTFTMQYGKF